MRDAAGRSISIRIRPGTDPGSLVRNYHFGETVEGRGGNSIVVSYESAKAHLSRIEETFGEGQIGMFLAPDDWVGSLWRELRREGKRERLPMDQLVGIFTDSTAGHELEHAWRMSRGLSHDEDSAVFGGAQYSAHPIETLVLLFFSQINSDEYHRRFSGRDRQDPDGPTRLSFDFRDRDPSDGRIFLTTHARAVKELFVSLALQYGVEGPYGDEDLVWVKTLFEKIRTVTPYEEINASLLRRRVALAYRERFGMELKPVEQLLSRPKATTHDQAA